MADPISISALAAVGMGATAAGGGVKAIGNLMTGDAQAHLDSYRANIAMMDSVIKAQDAHYAVASGGVEAEQAGFRTADEVAKSKVGFAAGNISTTTGTAGKVISSEIAIGQQNEAILRANAAKRAYGFEVASAEDVAQSNIYRMAAKNDRTSSYINAASTILGTVGKVSSMAIGGGKQGSGVFS